MWMHRRILPLAFLQLQKLLETVLSKNLNSHKIRNNKNIDKGNNSIHLEASGWRLYLRRVLKDKGALLKCRNGKGDIKVTEMLKVSLEIQSAHHAWMCQLIRCILGCILVGRRGVHDHQEVDDSSGDFMERSQYLIGKQDVEQKGGDNTVHFNW